MSLFVKYLKYISLLLFFSNLIVAQTGGVLSYPDARTVAIGSQAAVTATGVPY